jgi:methylated-DNA-protein-cysteine methyltransferase-like protein
MGRKHEEIYAVVRRIPRGRVATYGQVARLVAPPCDARQMSGLRGE